jgi:hypothetical protein
MKIGTGYRSRSIKFLVAAGTGLSPARLRSGLELILFASEFARRRQESHGFINWERWNKTALSAVMAAEQADR